MESREVVIDTSIFIDFLRAKNKTSTILYKIADNINICISSVTLYELLMGATNENKRVDVITLTKDLIALPFSENVATKAAEIYHELRKTNKMIEFRDIFIAATCIVNKAHLLTLNKKHFVRINGLHVQ